MTEQEWMNIGYDKGIIEVEQQEEVTFADAYRKWFLMQLRRIKNQTCDRIEVTYNKYYANKPFVTLYVSKITEEIIIEFLTTEIISQGDINYKELSRIMQIIREPLIYMKDIKQGGVRLYDWDAVKRCLPQADLRINLKKEYAIPSATVRNLTDLVVRCKVYPDKQSACLCLMMNFYLGLRIGELASLTFDDFDFDKNVVNIYKTESKFYNRTEDGSRSGCMVYRVVDNTKTVYSVRQIPLLPEVKMFYAEIKKHHEQCKYDSPYLAYDGHDTILVRSLDRTLRRLCLLTDTTYFNSHLIRKTFATHMHHNGAPIRMIADLMGHSEIATTENSYILSYEDHYKDYYREMKESLQY